MSFSAAFGLILITVVAMFVLVFVLAGVESRLFDDVMVTPEPEAPVESAVLEPAPELGAAA